MMPVSAERLQADGPIRLRRAETSEQEKVARRGISAQRHSRGVAATKGASRARTGRIPWRATLRRSRETMLASVHRRLRGTAALQAPPIIVATTRWLSA